MDSNVLMIIFLSLFIYSCVSTFLFVLSKENENVLLFFGLGIFGIILVEISKVVRWIVKKWKRIHSRSIFLDIKANQKVYCKLVYTEDVRYWSKDYRIIKRYAKKSEWKQAIPMEQETLEKLMINCDNCLYAEDCQKHPRCKHDFEAFLKK